MRERASRTGMQELTVRAMLHGARLGTAGDAEAAALLAGGHRQPAAGAARGGRRGQLSTRSSIAPYSATLAPRIIAPWSSPTPSPRNASTASWLSQRS